MSFFQGGSDKQDVSGSQTIEIPTWVRQAGEQLFQKGVQTADRPYPIYRDQRIASFTPDEISAFDLTRSNVGSWTAPYAAATMGSALSAQPISAGDIGRYMSPFTGEAIDRAVSELNRQYGRDRIGRSAAMAHRGSYLNEDRREVIENLARESRDRVIGETTAGMYERAFANALEQANKDRARQFDVSRYFGQLGPLGSSLGYADAGALKEIGGEQRDLAQQVLTLKNEDFMRQFGYPQEQINYLTSLLRGVPYQTTTNTTGQQIVPKSNPFTSALGAAAAIAGIGGPSGFGLWSDRRLKRDIQQIGQLASGLPIYAFRYLWNNVLHIGVMADEVLQVHPGAVLAMPNGYLAVDYERIW